MFECSYYLYDQNQFFFFFFPQHSDQKSNSVAWLQSAWQKAAALSGRLFPFPVRPTLSCFESSAQASGCRGSARARVPGALRAPCHTYCPFHSHLPPRLSLPGASASGWRPATHVSFPETSVPAHTCHSTDVQSWFDGYFFDGLFSYSEHLE